MSIFNITAPAILPIYGTLTVVAAVALKRDNDEWLGMDKPLHLGASAVAGVVSALVFTGSPETIFAIGMVPGVVKEFMDSRNGGSGWSAKDLVADMCGVAFGMNAFAVIANMFK